MNWIAFEIMIGDICEEENIKTAKELEELSEQLHQHLENSILDYTLDYNIEGYEPNY